MADLATVSLDTLLAKIDRVRPRRQAAAQPALWFNPPATEARLAAAERAMGVPFPADYRRFLAEVGDGGSGPPAYGLYSLDQAFDESFNDKGIYSFADPFVPPDDEAAYVDLDAPGLFLLGHQGCSFWDGLVVAGPERGTVWTFVEARPGWIPLADQRAPLLAEDGTAYQRDRRSDDYAPYYARLLAPENHARRLSFSRYYEQWLDAQLGAQG